MNKFLAKHHKTAIIIGCITKNVATAIALENILISGIIGFMTALMIKCHLYDNHPLLHIRRVFKHQEIELNSNKQTINNEAKYENK